MQGQQTKYLQLKRVIPSAPKTKRGDFSSLDVHSDHFLYFNGPTMIVRPLDQSLPVKTLTHKTDVLVAKFSNDGKLIASIDQKGTLIVSELGQKQLFQCKKYQNFYVNAKAIDWTSDRKRICVVGAGKNSFGRVVLLDTGTNAGEITGVSANLTCCSFRPERPYHLATGGDQHILKFHQGPPYKFSKSSQKSHSSFINAVKFSPAGSFIISVSSDKKIVLYNGQNFDLLKQKVNSHQRSIMGADWIDNKTFLTVSADKTIKIWSTDLQQLSQIKCCKQDDFKNAKNIDYFQVAVKYYKDKIYSLSLNGEISEYSLPSEGQKIVEYNPQKVIKYAGWLQKPSCLLNISSSLQQQKIVILDSFGRTLSFSQGTSPKFNQKIQLLSQSFSTKPLITSFYSSKHNALYTLWCDGQISQIKLNQKLQILQQNLKIDDTNSKLIIKSSTEDFDFICVNDRLNGVLQNKVTKSSQKFNQDVTFVKGLNGLLAVGTIKGNLYFYSSSTLQLLNQMNVSSTRISQIYIEQSQNNQQFTLISGNSLGKFSVLKFNLNTKEIDQISCSLGNHQSMITSIISYKSEYLLTFGMDNKINLWRKIEEGKYSRMQDWRNVHNFGILSSEIVGERLFTIGGDYLIRQWKIIL